MNEFASQGRPFLFIIDYELQKPLIFPLDELPEGLKYITPLGSNTDDKLNLDRAIDLRKYPVNFDLYSESFRNVISNIAHGNSYLLNLTFPTELEINFTLEEIFYRSRAKYKLLLNDDFVVFSPEIFVQIDNCQIKSFPMKGTIDASAPDAINTILNDEKELSEHNTIVDLIRNDLSIVANNVEVIRYRYADLIKTNDKDLIQISSEISGTLSDDWKLKLGDIILSLLPAGSISGAPKKETVRIIRESEKCDRGYYTGVFGLFDGERVDSAIMIRFIEQSGGKYVYKSGGGITYLSEARKEYDELISKVYVPVG